VIGETGCQQAIGFLSQYKKSKLSYGNTEQCRHQRVKSINAYHSPLIPDVPEIVIQVSLGID